MGCDTPPSGTRVYESTGDIIKVADHLQHRDEDLDGYAKRHEERSQEVIEEW